MFASSRLKSHLASFALCRMALEEHDMQTLMGNRERLSAIKTLVITDSQVKLEKYLHQLSFVTRSSGSVSILPVKSLLENDSPSLLVISAHHLATCLKETPFLTFLIHHFPQLSVLLFHCDDPNLRRSFEVSMKGSANISMCFLDCLITVSPYARFSFGTTQLNDSKFSNLITRALEWFVTSENADNILAHMAQHDESQYLLSARLAVLSSVLVAQTSHAQDVSRVLFSSFPCLSNLHILTSGPLDFTFLRQSPPPNLQHLAIMRASECHIRPSNSNVLDLELCVKLKVLMVLHYPLSCLLLPGDGGHLEEVTLNDTTLQSLQLSFDLPRLRYLNVAGPGNFVVSITASQSSLANLVIDNASVIVDSSCSLTALEQLVIKPFGVLSKIDGSLVSLSSLVSLCTFANGRADIDFSQPSNFSSLTHLHVCMNINDLPTLLFKNAMPRFPHLQDLSLDLLVSDGINSFSASAFQGLEELRAVSISVMFSGNSPFHILVQPREDTFPPLLRELHVMNQQRNEHWVLKLPSKNVLDLTVVVLSPSHVTLGSISRNYLESLELKYANHVRPLALDVDCLNLVHDQRQSMDGVLFHLVHVREANLQLSLSDHDDGLQWESLKSLVSSPELMGLAVELTESSLSQLLNGSLAHPVYWKHLEILVHRDCLQRNANICIPEAPFLSQILVLGNDAEASNDHPLPSTQTRYHMIFKNALYPSLNVVQFVRVNQQMISVDAPPLAPDCFLIKRESPTVVEWKSVRIAPSANRPVITAAPEVVSLIPTESLFSSPSSESSKKHSMFDKCL